MSNAGNLSRGRIMGGTGGGHTATLNWGLAGMLYGAEESNYEFEGFLEGWKGAEEDELTELTGREDLMSQVRDLADLVYSDEVEHYLKDFREQNVPEVELKQREEELLHSFYQIPIAGQGGSILYSSRTDPDIERVKQTIDDNDIDAVVALGGDDTLGVLADIDQSTEIMTAGWPKTMDNDLKGTEFCSGYPSAVRKAAKVVYDAKNIAETHNRVAVICPFGRNSDWIAGGSAARGEADLVIPAEMDNNLNEIIYRTAEKAREKAHPHAVVVAAEGAYIDGLESHVEYDEVDEFGHPKLNPLKLADGLKTVLGDSVDEVEKGAPITLTYELRDGPPIDLIDGIEAFKLGKKCIELLDNNKSGKMATVEYDERGRLQEGSSNLKSAAKQGERLVREEAMNLLDYDNLEPSEGFKDYLRQFMTDLETVDRFNVEEADSKSSANHVQN